MSKLGAAGLSVSRCFRTAILALSAVSAVGACARSSEPAATERPKGSATAAAAASAPPSRNSARALAPDAGTGGDAQIAPRPLGQHWLQQLPQGTTQLVRVASPSWGASDASLERYALEDGGWRRVGEAEGVVIGKAGLGWGRGLHRAEPDGPQKAEGDGRAPAGLFRLSHSFGHGPGAKLDTGLPHTPVSPSFRCVDDPRSARYTQIVDVAELARRGEALDWQSAERMQRSDPLYEIVILADHNPAPPVAGAGSCIFLHTWRSQGATPRPTVGCTAMPRAALLSLAAWLKPGAILAQLPAPQLHRE